MSGPSPTTRPASLRAALGGLRNALLHFVLPLLGFGLTLWAVEAGAEAFGYHQDVVQVLRMGVIPLYVVIAMLARRKKD